MTTATQIGREKEVQNLWDKFLDLIKSRVSINTYSTWFQPTRLNRAEGDTLYVQIPSTVFRQVLTRTYGEIVKAVFHQMGTPQMKVQYVCTEEEPTASLLASPMNLRMLLPARSPSSLPRLTTRSSCTVAWEWARPT
jgi:chromosomal replication initiation ATPase DnaA